MGRAARNRLTSMSENLAFRVRRITADDADEWTRLRCELWPEGQEDHAPEIASFFAGALPDVAEVLVAETSKATIVAFAELSIRTDLPPLIGMKVGYVEGLYVIPEARGS